MIHKPLRIALVLDLKWSYKRHAVIFAGTQKYADQFGWHSIIDEFAHHTLANCNTKNVPYDGIIARANHTLFKQAQRLHIPVVNVWGSSPVRAKLPSVYPDFAMVGEQCAEHLISRGFRNFAAIYPLKTYAQETLVKGYKRVINAAGFSCSSHHISQDTQRNQQIWHSTSQTIQNAVMNWKSPLGVYVADESDGRMVAQACHWRGLRVPADVAIIAGQNEETLCVHPSPSLTSMEMGFERIGYEAARLLHQLLETKKNTTPQIMIPPIGLVVRESTDFYSVEDEQVAAAMRFIAANAHKQIGPNEVAKAVKVEMRTLQNRFGKFLNRPIATEIRRVRMERAKRELSQSNKQLAEIARLVGFGGIMRMYEVFRRELGISPGQFRKQTRLQNEP
jgi:LacI family transcriptional regulator